MKVSKPISMRQILAVCKIEDSSATHCPVEDWCNLVETSAQIIVFFSADFEELLLTEICSADNVITELDIMLLCHAVSLS